MKRSTIDQHQTQGGAERAVQSVQGQVRSQRGPLVQRHLHSRGARDLQVDVDLLARVATDEPSEDDDTDVLMVRDILSRIREEQQLTR